MLSSIFFPFNVTYLTINLGCALFRRTFNEQILHIIKDGGAYSTKHVLLVYLQTALHDQSLPVASLLLQLDILVSMFESSPAAICFT